MRDRPASSERHKSRSPRRDTSTPPRRERSYRSASPKRHRSSSRSSSPRRSESHRDKKVKKKEKKEKKLRKEAKEKVEHSEDTSTAEEAKEPPTSNTAYDFFAQLREQEAKKGPLGTIHASGAKPTPATAITEQSGKWECSKSSCGHLNPKNAPLCTQCGAMKRMSEWR